jgi:predicted CoA-binding protein
MKTPHLVERFLRCRRIAFVGLSRHPRDFSRVLFRDLVERGYDVVPVSPHDFEVQGRRTFPLVRAIKPPVEAALVMTPPQRSEEVVLDCAAAGVQLVWLHRGAGTGAVSPEALRAAADHGLEVVPGECPYMYLDAPGFVHAAHRFLRRLFAGKAAAA